MNTFIRLTIILENTKLAEMGVRDEIHAPLDVKADLIESYRPFVNDQGEPDDNELVIHLMTGTSYSVKCTMNQMRNMLEK